MFGGRKFDPKRLKTNLMLCSTRVKQLQKKGENLALRERKDIAEQLQRKKFELAKVRTEQVIRDDYLVEAYEVIELYVSTLHSRIGLISSKRDTPVDKGIEEHVASLVWVTQHLYDRVPELREITLELEKRYGKQYVADCMDEKGVSKRLMKKLKVEAPPKGLVEQYLYVIAKKYDVREYLDHLEAEAAAEAEVAKLDPSAFDFGIDTAAVGDPSALPAIPGMLPMPAPMPPPGGGYGGPPQPLPQQQQFPSEYPSPAPPVPAPEPGSFKQPFHAEGPPGYYGGTAPPPQASGPPPGMLPQVPPAGAAPMPAPYGDPEIGDLPSPPGGSALDEVLNLPVAPSDGAAGGFGAPPDSVAVDRTSTIDYDDLTERFNRLKDEAAASDDTDDPK